MKERVKLKKTLLRTSSATGVAILFILLPMIAQAKQAKAPTCNALVSVTNDLFLVAPNGKVLTRFTSDGAAKDYAVISPNGHKVAYASQGANETSYQVVDRYGRQGSFPVYSAQSGNNGSSAEDHEAKGPLMGLFWSSNDVLRLEKHVSPTTSRFEFHKINKDLTGGAPIVGSPGAGNSCVLEHNGGRIACLQGGDVSVHSKIIFSESEFAGLAHVASFTLTKGASTTVPGTSGFEIKVISIDQYGIGLQVTFPNGNWEKMSLSGGDFLKIPGVRYDYAFFATLVSSKSGLVRVDEVKKVAGESEIFDPAIAWQPRGPGLILVRRAGNQAVLNLIQPRENGNHEHRRHDKGHEWNLVAKAQIDMPSTVQTMLFATPYLLLLQTENGKFDEMPIHITNGQDKGKPSLTTGTVTPLPSTIPVTTKGKSTEAPVLDWSCKSSHGDDDQGD